VALLLRRRGLERVRPLSGGFDAWREHGLPVESEDGISQQSKSHAAPEPIPETLGESVVLDETGQPVLLGDLWKDRTVVLAFVRQFGCVLCREFVIELRNHQEAFHVHGADVFVVGNGEPDAAARFRDTFDLNFPVFVDPHRRVFQLLGFRRNLGGSANPAVLLAALRAWFRGARQGKTEGDPWQLGGILIVRPSGEVSYRYASRFAGDHPKIGEVLRQLLNRA
jgi:prostamide/prostaglandin F2alpha synthase